jgi:hypothetical protein
LEQGEEKPANEPDLAYQYFHSAHSNILRLRKRILELYILCIHLHYE